ncbi:hypothetical protein D9758_008823 [Tetrapyrgos nigripes]|uniref:Uncharacterized protein n=1 Tax=Tetrapyrgos nigripes TaxID=182062 RepID=A0A8H5FPA7_9AGAR|nr:hypothetical protein D9758_008823 [Tetrapyrgos nigripes]
MEAARRTTPFTVTPFVSEYSKHSSPGPEPFKTMPAIGTVPSLPFVPPPPIPPPDKKHDPPPAFVAGTSDLGRHGSMYKPRRSEESLPPTEYGYGVGMSRDEWVQYEAKLKS